MNTGPTGPAPRAASLGTAPGGAASYGRAMDPVEAEKTAAHIA